MVRMPKKEIDYSNTIIYKISCKSPNISDVYVGHTTNFVQRKYAHKGCCMNKNSPSYGDKVYNIIRNNGGWDNWTMEIVSFFNCNNLYEAQQKEQEYYLLLNATLNSIDPLIYKSNTLVELPTNETCQTLSIYTPMDTDSPTLQTVENTVDNEFEVNDSNKNIDLDKQYCDLCNYNCIKQSEWNRHIITQKHKKRTDDLMILSKVSKCSCGKAYKHRQSLFNHKKKCSYVPDDTELQNVLIDEKDNTSPIAVVTNDVILNLITQNQELQKQLIEMSKQSSIVNNNNNNNTTMNQFNLNVFLNESCKNALNIVDFVESLKLTVNDLEQTGKLGYVDGITRILVQALQQLDVNMRPLHCTDVKREIVYVKDQNIWEKENGQKTKLRNIVSKIARKNLKMMPLWQEQNPKYQFLDTVENNNFIKLSLSALGPASKEEYEKQEDKIIRNVLKEVLLEKNKKVINS